MLLALLRLTSLHLVFCISLEHGLHEGHALIAPRLLEGLVLGLRGLTCCCLKGLTIAVIAAAVQGVVSLVGTAMGLATLAKLLNVTLLRGLTSRAPRCPALWVTLGFGSGCTSLTFHLDLLVVLLNQDCSMASRSSSNVQAYLLGTIEWLRLHWFCHDIGTDASTIAARSALQKGIFPFFVIGTALRLSFNVGRCLT